MALQVINFYAFLAIPNFSSIEVISKKYKELALMYHPDREGGDVEKMKILNSIYGILKREKDRYDNWLKNQLGIRPNVYIHIINVNGFWTGGNNSTTTGSSWVYTGGI